MSSRLAGVARLVRLPNTLTTVADVLAGAAVAWASTAEASRDATALVPVALAAMSLYAFGMALNDYVDRDKDARLHPGRPLPSGLVSPRGARLVIALSAAFALGLLALAGAKTVLLGSALIGCIWLYDVVLERATLPASIAMGCCRGLCLALGVAAAGGFGDPGALTGWQLAHVRVLLPSLAYVALITLVTAVSLFEERPAGGSGAAVLISLLFVAYLAPAAWSGHTAWLIPLGLLLGAAVIAPARHRPPRVGLVVRNAVFTLPLWDALHALSVGDVEVALACAAVFPLVRLAAGVLAQRSS